MSRELEQQRQQWSVLMDGEADAPSTAALCATWRTDAECRRTWHAWHLVGDVLRSDDLASSPSRDAHFIAALRQRLAAEPIVLAPRAGASRRRWTTMTAVAAGFAAVAGTAVVMKVSTSSAEAPVLAQRQAESPSVRTAQAAPAAPVEPRFVAADGQLIRDARLDRYLAAHKPVGGGRALPGSIGVPGPVEAGYSR